MRYTLVWTPTAEDDLATIWMDAPDRNAVTGAARKVDESLRIDPGDQGESRTGDLRIVFFPPLVVEFRVSDDDRTVYVLALWTMKSRRSPS